MNHPSSIALNAICPYFTMFPLAFPKRILDRHASKGHRVLDPFCGRGTTNFAARISGLDTLGIDSSPVAAAITAAKLSMSNPKAIVRAAQQILNAFPSSAVPTGEFWELAYHPGVLRTLARIRAGLLADCSSNARRVLRGIILGALHGPRTKELSSYFSNQSTRTYAPKPKYSVKYWKAHKQIPPLVNVLGLILQRAERYLSQPCPACLGEARLADSRDPDAITSAAKGRKFDWVITSPPYYGMRTYLQDQWLRQWFVGGSDNVNYSAHGQINHLSPECFTAELSQVWHNVANVCRDEAKMVIRFGGIRDRNAEPLDLVRSSLSQSGWRITTINDAGSADVGRRQADSFLAHRGRPMSEYDIWARRT